MTEEETFSHRKYVQKSYTYTATALAIKYTNTIYDSTFVPENKMAKHYTLSGSTSLSPTKLKDTPIAEVTPAAASSTAKTAAEETTRSVFR